MHVRLNNDKSSSITGARLLQKNESETYNIFYPGGIIIITLFRVGLTGSLKLINANH